MDCGLEGAESKERDQATAAATTPQASERSPNQSVEGTGGNGPVESLDGGSSASSSNRMLANES